MTTLRRLHAKDYVLSELSNEWRTPREVRERLAQAGIVLNAPTVREALRRAWMDGVAEQRGVAWQSQYREVQDHFSEGAFNGAPRD